MALGFASSLTNNSEIARAQEMATTAVSLSASTGAAPPLLAWGVAALGSMMLGRPEDAIAPVDQVLENADEEPDLFVRAQGVQFCLSVVAVLGDVDRVQVLERLLAPMVERLGNGYVASAVTSSMAPVLHLIDPEHAHARLLQSIEFARAARNDQQNSSTYMFLALHELRSGDVVAAARSIRESLQLAVEHAPTLIPQSVDTVIAITKRHSPRGAAMLLGALRAHRSRRQQVGTPPEIDAEARYAASLRRALGDEFDPLFAEVPRSTRSGCSRSTTSCSTP